MKRFLCCLLVLATPLLADEVADSRAAYKAAAAAYAEKNFPEFLAKVREASDLRPNHPSLLLQYAGALALNGQPDAALARLERVAAMGLLAAQLDKEEDLASLRELPRFRAVLKRFEANARAIGQAREAFTIDALGVLPEGMAYDAGAKRWFVSSVRQRRIFAIDAKGTSKPFVENLPFGAFGLVYDKPRGVLWAASSALAQVEGVKKEDFGRSSLLKIDGRTGRVLETIGAPDSERHHFNDVALGADGSVYVSDGGTSTVLRLRGKSLETFAQGPFVSLQGLAVDGPTMYVADYSKGLYAVDIATRAIRLLRVPDDVTFLGIDGLYVAGRRTLMATQNGVAPNRVVRIRLSADGLGIEKMETLLANMPGFGDPTLGVVAGDRFYFNANAQWDLYADDGSISDPVKLQNPVVMWVPVR